MKFQDTVLKRFLRKYYTSANKVLRGSEADRKLDIFLAPADAAFQDGKRDLLNVLRATRARCLEVNLIGDSCLVLRFAELGLNTFIKRDGNGKYIVARNRWCVGEPHAIEEGEVIQQSGSVAEWFHHEQIPIDGSMDIIARLRKGMKFGLPRKLSNKVSWIDNSMESSRANSRTRSSLRGRSRSSAGRLTGLGITTNSSLVSSSGQKIKRDEGSAPERLSELLEAFGDAIAGHRPLLEDGKMLHRDISENNIIITTPAAEGDPKGRLIDMDLGKELNSVPSGASHRTGTMQFMAIEMCIHYGHNTEPDGEELAAPSSKPNKRRVRPTKTSILRGWYTGTYAEIANIKRGHMVGFEDITVEFAPEFINLRQLAEDLMDVLFPIRGKLFIGTYKDRNIMYGGIINAFNKAISHLGEEQANP
ncbi:hypothetical protein G7Y89_g12294 [Cudoniella acicularis]|uniref:non-specific serine/threonine protein kinase n=1 Tax=Cudoniella acicularis TaxID=354080 RepID=A0A8H4RBT3_9HELO|nr:hypothetical protein G7Y89_g12294 [Cudoniella acicularis]